MSLTMVATFFRRRVELFSGDSEDPPFLGDDGGIFSSDEVHDGGPQFRSAVRCSKVFPPMASTTRVLSGGDCHGDANSGGDGSSDSTATAVVFDSTSFLQRRRDLDRE
ncbi:hypothetical protein M6B38_321220 [Iris pallida]|uniref:Uncharacterized protein n=1 Tax=Iris pallida TaxID=29817 RepID=A0AAX6HCL2_IRIPA|nr:hypothetical protein M6B38_321220 [Iris pallida]